MRRRGASKPVTILVALVVGVLIGAILGYALSPKAPVTTTVTAPSGDLEKLKAENEQLKAKIEELTKKLASAGEGEITIKVWTIGPDPPSEYRLKNFQIAADMLNKWLAALGSKVRVKIDGQFFVRPVEWGEYKNKFYLAYKSGKAPDIYLTGHEDVGFLAANGYIIPLDDYIKEYWDVVYYDVIPTLWEAVKYQGKIWAVPQDTEARPIYFRKDILKKLGWSDEEIAQLPEKVRKGEFTLKDLLEVAKEAVDKGLVERGILHRVKEGYDYFQFYLAYGGRLWDAESGKMVFTKSAWRKTLQWFHDAVWKYKVISPTQFSGDWDKDFHGPFTQGKALFLSGGTWHKGEWVSKGLLTNEEFNENIGYMLHPAGEPGKKPVTLSHPLIYTITKQAQERGVADVAFLLITLVTDPHLNANHAVQSSHLAILYSEISDSRYRKEPFLADVAYMLDYTTFIPNHPKWGDYSRIVFNVLRGVESGDLTPDQAFNELLNGIKGLGSDAVIIED